jgi:hypothetical protein
MASEHSTLLRRRGALQQASGTWGHALFVATVLVGHVIALRDGCRLPEGCALRARVVPRVTRRRKCALWGKTKGIGAKAAAAAFAATRIPATITARIIACSQSLAKSSGKTLQGREDIAKRSLSERRAEDVLDGQWFMDQKIWYEVAYDILEYQRRKSLPHRRGRSNTMPKKKQGKKK